MSIIKYILVLTTGIATIPQLSANNLALESFDSIFVYDASVPELMTDIGHTIEQYAFSCRGNYIFSYNSEEFAVWDRHSRRIIKSFDLRNSNGKRYSISDMAPDIRNEKWLVLQFNNSIANSYPAVLFDWTTGRVVAYLNVDKWNDRFGHYKKLMHGNELVLYDKGDASYYLAREGSNMKPHYAYPPSVIGSAKTDDRDSLLFCSGMHEILWDMRHARSANLPKYKAYLKKNDTTLDHRNLDSGLPIPKAWKKDGVNNYIDHEQFSGRFSSPTTYIMGGVTPELNVYNISDSSYRVEKLPQEIGPVFDVKDHYGWRVIACWDGIYGGPIGGPYKRYNAFNSVSPLDTTTWGTTHIDKQILPVIYRLRNCAIAISEPYADGRFLTSKIGGAIYQALASGWPDHHCLVEGKFGVDTILRVTDNAYDIEERLEDIKIIRDGRYAICSHQKALWEMDLSNSEIIKLNRIFITPRNISERIYACEVLPDGRYVVGTDRGRIMVVDPATAVWVPTDTVNSNTIKSRLYSAEWVFADSSHSARISSISLSTDSTKMFTADYNGLVTIWDTATITPIVTLYNLYPFGVLAITPDRYYCFDQFIKYKLNQIAHFSKDNRVFTLDQFDIKYNRPDIIITRLGGDAEYARLLNLAWHKRLRNAGISEEQLSDDFHVPEIEITNLDDITSTTNEDVVTLEVDISDSREKLDRIFLWVNNVPQFGINGKRINDTIKHITIPINLASGSNDISVSVMNNRGTRSRLAEVSVSKIGKKTSKLWVVAIGVSEYDNKQYSLTYAAKDAKDFAHLANKSINAFDKIETLTITNKKFDINALTKVSEFLTQAGRDDAVIIFYAGHGVLDSNLDYYLAPYDMDFSEPSLRGITMDMFTGILENIAPLKRYVIIDACHSGGIDKEIYLSANTSAIPKNPSAITFRNAGNMRKLSAEALTISKLAAELFTSYNLDAGATVISSAAGTEVAVESDSWHNGLFTYLLKEGLGKHRNEAEENNIVTLESLVEYATLRAAEMSNNNQNPQIKTVNSTTLTIYK